MSGTDIFISILSAVMLFGGLYLNFVSRRLSDEYAAAHRVQPASVKSSTPKNVNPKKK